MGKAYSTDLRERIEAHISAGHSRRDASRRVGVSPSFAVKLAQRVAVTGSVAPARQGRPPGGGKLAAHLAKLKAERGVAAHPASLSRALLAWDCQEFRVRAGIMGTKETSHAATETPEHPG